ncbi:hypothetical protein [Priestia megaterium]|uniref:hypothetical protein n=1 Tax=Priestia megaterium TaxID=1404 RepID=UPI000BFE566F|nr:hypothetical protein [Priestia megaterium]PGN04348.1 hypothetical protein CN955_21500 [Priestia megaterium]
MEQMSYKDTKELILYAFKEYEYANFSILGATTAILRDFNDYFEPNSKGYYNYIKSLYLINCTSDNLEWYKKNRPGFLKRRLIPDLKRNIDFEPAEFEMQELIKLVDNYLSDKDTDINMKNDLISKIEETEETEETKETEELKYFIFSMYDGIQSTSEKVNNPEKQNLSEQKTNQLEESIYKFYKTIKDIELPNVPKGFTDSVYNPEQSTSEKVSNPEKQNLSEQETNQLESIYKFYILAKEMEKLEKLYKNNKQFRESVKSVNSSKLSPIFEKLIESVFKRVH